MKTNHSRGTMVLAGAFSLLVTLISVGQAQPRPATLTPSVNSAMPGMSVRVTVRPVIGLNAQSADQTSVVLRPSRAQGPQTDVVLTMSEYHGGWFQVRIPEDAHSGLAAYQMLWLDRTGDVLASSGKALFRISADMPLDDRRSGAGVDTGAGKGRTQIKPRPDDDVGNARDGGVQGTTMSGKTKQLKTPVVDYVVIIGGDGVEVRGGRYPFEFTLPSDARLNDRGVLTFLVNGEDKGGPPVGEVRGLPVFNIKINGHEVESITLANLVTRAWTVTFDARILQSGRNEIIFSGAGGGYRVKVTDAVLWFHRDIAW